MESFETNVESLPSELKRYLEQNTAQSEIFIKCYLLKDSILFGAIVSNAVVALTNHRLLLKYERDALGFHYYIWKTVAFDGGIEDRFIIRLSTIRRTGYTRKLVLLDLGNVDKHGESRALGIEFGNEKDAKNFGILMKKVLAEYSIAPIATKDQTSAPDIADQLLKLAKLREDGMLTEEEYKAAKRKLIS